jgi:hypothetical protein
MAVKRGSDDTPRMTLADVRRLSAAIAFEEDPSLEVIAATSAEGAVDSSEVIVIRRDRDCDPCRVVVRVDRRTDESHLRQALRERLRAYLRDDQSHAATAD